MPVREDIRNIAIIAHVDHGKTTLVDQLLIQAGTFRANERVSERMLDSNELERERGITILAKNTAIRHGGVTINILDTPGHADFGGEVERIMKMVEGVILVVDAAEGCMPQTRFVLKKALAQRVMPLVVINKIDREHARPAEVLNEVYDLFIDLGATEEQLEFPVYYASATKGTAGLAPDRQDPDMRVLLDGIVAHIPAPTGDPAAPFQFQVTMLDYNDYLGRIGIGRIHRGAIRVGDTVAQIRADGAVVTAKILKLFGFRGLKREEIESAAAGDIIAIPGIPEIMVSDTIASVEQPDPLPLLKIDEPTLKMSFTVNDSPMAGRDGEHVTSNKLRDRLRAALETDVSLRVETITPEHSVVSGRGELHLSFLIETMRREGYELQVSKPEPILKVIDGVRCEPCERLYLDLPEEYLGAVMETLGARKAELADMCNDGFGHVKLEFLIPSRALIGYRSELMTLTRGYGIMNHAFDSYRPYATGYTGERRAGVLISMNDGRAAGYSLESIEGRGELFIHPGTEVYEGMIIGEHSHENDLVVNATREKHASNMRSSNKDIAIKLKTPRLLTLEAALEYLNDDELCEVTPHFIRLRKKDLTQVDRKRADRRAAAAMAAAG